MTQQRAQQILAAILALPYGWQNTSGVMNCFTDEEHSEMCRLWSQRKNGRSTFSDTLERLADGRPLD